MKPLRALMATALCLAPSSALAATSGTVDASPTVADKTYAVISQP